MTFEQTRSFQTRMRKMSYRACSRTKSRYFSLAAITNLSSSLTSKKKQLPFLEAYGSYVLYRCKHFSSSFSEGLVLKGHHGDASEGAFDYATQSAQLHKVMKRMKHAIEAALSCSVDKSWANDVVVPCLDLLCRDLEQLIPLYEDHLLHLIAILKRDQHVPYSLTKPHAVDTSATPSIVEIDSTPISREIRQHIRFCEFYLDLHKSLEKWVNKHTRILRSFDFQFIELVRDDALVERVSNHLKELLAASDGPSPPLLD